MATKPLNVAQKLIKSHLVEGEMIPGKEIGLKIDQTLTQDATGTLVMQELESMGLQRAKTELSAQYVDHNLIQEDFRNPDDHVFLQSACQKFGLWFSRAGNGVSHPVHMESFAKPGKTLLGSDSHTCANGCMGMLAMGAGGNEVALAIAGYPFHVPMPKIWGVKLTGKLPNWVSAKDIILEMLRRHTVKGGVGCVIEYYGPGLKYLDAMDRHVIANMGAELGATGTVFPADAEIKKFLKQQKREKDFKKIEADKGATYDKHDEINLSQLVPLIALPSSPDKVVPVREVAGKDLYQAYIGSSANPGYRDFVMSAMMVKGREIPAGVSFDINPTTRNILEDLSRENHLSTLVHAGARIHQVGCNGCIGMGQAPATDRNSLRTVPRNFPGRSGTVEDKVFLCSPETATASAIKGKIIDPRDLKIPYPKIKFPKQVTVNRDMLQPPLPAAKAKQVELIKGPNIFSLPDLAPLRDSFKIPVILKVGDNISTDEILPAGAKVLPYRSNIPKISEFCFDIVDPTYADRARAVRKDGGHMIVGGENYGQGSSREHAALAPRFLGLHIVIAKSFARIHWQNLINFGVLPLTFANPADYEKINQGDIVIIDEVKKQIKAGSKVMASIEGKPGQIELKHSMSPRQIEVLFVGGLINWVKKQL